MDLLDGIIKGLIVGIVASAPMGPVGVLIVQRTLNKGRWFGFVTGVGAALSDMLYALVCGCFLQLFIDFLDAHRTALQFASSLMLFVFGLWTYFTRPKTHLPKGKTQKNLIQNGVTGFLLTIGNPIIVFLFLALFAHFNFVTDDRLKLIVEFASVFFGALGWWLGLTYIINKARTRFNEDRIRVLNRTIGVVVMVVSLMAIFFTITGKMHY